MSTTSDSSQQQLPTGAGRVQLKFEPSGQDVRVPPGVSVFDAASWNGLAIDSTCGGHGTCKKCKVQILEGQVPVSNLDTRAFTAEQLADGWRLACVARAQSDLKIDVSCSNLPSKPSKKELAKNNSINKA